MSQYIYIYIYVCVYVCMYVYVPSENFSALSLETDIFPPQKRVPSVQGLFRHTTALLSRKHELNPPAFASKTSTLYDWKAEITLANNHFKYGFMNHKTLFKIDEGILHNQTLCINIIKINKIQRYPYSFYINWARAINDIQIAIEEWKWKPHSLICLKYSV